jgi:hypothetical protein
VIWTLERVKKRLSRDPYFEAFSQRGFVGLLDQFINRDLLWSAESRIHSTVVKSHSSISDEMPYADFCRLAVEDEEAFRNFKCNEEYRAVLEHCNYSQGLEYLNLLDREGSEFTLLKEIASDDNGNPIRFYYEGLGRVSPTQIRYAKVLQDLHALFGSLDSLKISEIGVGYGGQAIHILRSDLVSNYVFYDLEWPGKLAMKNMGLHYDKLRIFPHLGNPLDVTAVDLVISNYAFSELAREYQETYLKNVISQSKAGYVIYNDIQPDSSTALSAREFSLRVPGAEIFEELPLTFPGNQLVVWGHTKKDLNCSLFKRIF